MWSFKFTSSRVGFLFTTLRPEAVVVAHFYSRSFVYMLLLVSTNQYPHSIGINTKVACYLEISFKIEKRKKISPLYYKIS